ncbi:MAG: hypothetical protein N2504_07025 [candidate division WOR-3 bacterium]|nr:hypothetical protein [candidate division WOR-3 bacterium]MCX7948319.1 hypothetical protein [candidate division WOR-3 bacterium]MDW8150853.1 hypothetical protein [candidate division WOR-3 bacterium]
MRVLKSILDILITPVCPICENNFSSGICCDSCFLDLANDFNDYNRTRSLGITKAISVFVYSDRVKKLIEYYKYEGFLKIGRFFSELLSHKILAKRELFKEKSIIVPIPTSKARIRERGFDHTEYLAKEVSRITGVEYKKLLSSEYRPSQTKVKDRFENSKNRFFGISLSEYREYQIILLDDVITSGSTMLSAINVLSNLGYNDIVCLSVAMKI